MAHMIVTFRLRDHGITDKIEFTPEEFAQYQTQYDEILAQEAVIEMPEPDPVAVYTNAVQAHLDAEARKKNYDGILSAASYAALPVGDPFQAEGLVFAKWRSAVWIKCYEILEAIQKSQRTAPSVDGLLLELPVLTLPE
jgi:hypothetical protein